MPKFKAKYLQHQSAFDSGLRLSVLPISGVCALLQSYLILKATDSQVFAAVSILWSVVLLIPFADLGLGAVLTNTVAKSANPRTDTQVKLKIVSALRLLILSGTVIAIVAVILGRLGIWKHLAPNYADTVFDMDLATILLGIFIAVGLPVSIWQRIMLGLGFNWLVLLISGCAAPISLLFVWVALKSHNYELVGSAPALASIFVGLLGALTLMRMQRVSALSVFNAIFRIKQNGQIPLAAIAAPMLIILIVQPLALQSDRVVLGRMAPTQQLADYSIAAQLYLPALAVLSAGAASMWPRFAKSSDDVALTRLIYKKETKVLSVLAMVLALSLVLVGPTISSIVSEGALVPSINVFAAFGLLLIIQAITMPSAMMMTDPSGLGVQAVSLSIMMMTKLVISVKFFGTTAEGPIVASAISIFICQFTPCLLYVYRTRMRIKRVVTV